MPALINQVVKNVEGKVFYDSNLTAALAAEALRCLTSQFLKPFAEGHEELILGK